MNKSIIKTIAKISTISVLLVVLFNVGSIYFKNNDNTENKIVKTENKYHYKKANQTILGSTGVAIGTNLGIRFKERTSIPITIYKEVMSIGEIMTNKRLANENLVTINMIQVKEYLNVMRTDVKKLINNSHDKPATLKAFLSEIEYRYQSSNSTIKNLSTQRKVIEEAIIKNDQEITKLKEKINTDFGNFETQETLENIDEYLKLKKEYNYSRVYLIFIGQFLRQYTYLNSYNKTLLDTLINNREAIIKDAYIVIPDSGSELLKQFNLIYTEEDFKGRK